MWETFEGLVRLVVGGFLVAAGGAKMIHPLKWREAWLLSYRTLPRPLVVPVARLLPVLEIGGGLGLILGARFAAPVAAALLIAVTLTAATALIRGMRVSCGCLGATSALLSWRIVARNVVLTVATVALTAHGFVLPRMENLGLFRQIGIVALALFASMTAAQLSLGMRQRRLLTQLGVKQA